MITDVAIKHFLEAVWDAGKGGSPVNVFALDIYGDDPVAARKSATNVSLECERRGLIEMTLEGQVIEFTDRAKVLIGVE